MTPFFSRRRLLAIRKRSVGLTPKQRVLKRHPTAFYKHMGTVPHHRIWMTVDLGSYHADRMIGAGLSPGKAWEDALRRVDSAKASK